MKLPPKPSSLPTINAGDLILYENNSSPILAIVTEKGAAKSVVLNQFGAKVPLVANRIITIQAKHDFRQLDPSQLTTALADLANTAAEQAKSLLLSELWELVAEEVRPYSVHELSMLLPGQPGALAEVALWFRLTKDGVYFRRDTVTFTPRPHELVDELNKAEEVKRQRENLLAATLSWVGSCLAGSYLTPPDDIQPVIELLESFACESPHLSPTNLREVKSLLKDIKSSFAKHPVFVGIEDRNDSFFAYELLETIGHFGFLTNPALIRHRPPRNFSQAALTAAADLSISWDAVSSVRREKITAPFIVTIDDPSTNDMDDAVSIEQTQDGFKIGVHISDVAACFSPDTVLEREARNRATSIYLAEATINMLPSELATNRCSLVQGSERLTLSALIYLDHQLAITRTEVVPSKVTVSHRLAYQDLDQLLESGACDRIDHSVFAGLEQLFQFSVTNEGKRLANGAHKVIKHDVQVSVDESGLITLIDVDESSPARNMVAELMVVANCAFADFAKQNQVPLIYRSQEAPEPAAESGAPDGPAKEYQERGGFKRSVMSTEPLPHSSLAVPAYTQITSPIRRYLDLCNQRQLLYWFAQAKPYLSDSELEAVIEQVDRPLGLAGSLTKESRRFWLLKYLKQESKNSKFLHGVVLRTDMKNPLVELREVPLNIPVRCSVPVNPGDSLKLKIGAIEPVRDYIRLEVESRV